MTDEWTAYIASIFWGFELLLLKYSILCLYLRIFPNIWLKRAVFAFMAFQACFTLPLLGLAAFQCIPIRAIWDLKERGAAKCVDWIAVLTLTVTYEIIAEVVVFTLPIPIVWKLQMKTSKKIQLIVFFGLGLWYVHRLCHVRLIVSNGTTVLSRCPWYVCRIYQALSTPSTPATQS
jgi:hypothetical protein